MSCVWIALIKALPLRNRRRVTPSILFQYIKLHNVETPDITRNGIKLSKQEQAENFKAIENLDANCLEKGYDCSTADPLLFLVAQLYGVSIEHRFLKATIRYANGRNRWIRFKSSRTHFRT